MFFSITLFLPGTSYEFAAKWYVNNSQYVWPDGQATFFNETELLDTNADLNVTQCTEFSNKGIEAVDCSLLGKTVACHACKIHHSKCTFLRAPEF